MNPAARVQAWARARPGLLAVLALSVALNALGIGWGLPNDVSWAVDDTAPDKPLLLLGMWQGYHHKYPYFHWWTNLALYAPWLTWWRLTGQSSFPCKVPLLECFADPYAQLGTLILLTRGLHVAMGAGLCWLVYRISLRLFRDERAATLAALATACAPLVVYASHVGTLNLPSTFWLTASLLAALRALDSDRLSDHCAFGLLLGAAVATKEQIAGAYVLVGLGLYAAFLKRRVLPRSGGRLRAHLDPRLAALVLLPLITYAAIQNVVFNHEGWLAHLDHWIGESGSLARNEAPLYRGPVALAALFARELGNALGSPLLALCLAGAVVAGVTQPRRAAVLLLPAASYYLFTVQGVAQHVYTRLTLPVIPLLAIAAGYGVAAGLRRGRVARWTSVACAAVAIGHAALVSLRLDITFLRDTRYDAEAWLVENVPVDRGIGVFSYPYYLPRLAAFDRPVTRFDESAMIPGAFAATGPEWLVLSRTYHQRFDGRREGDFFASLLAGDGPYRVAWRHQRPPAFAGWPGLGSAWLPWLVNPEIAILERRPAAP